MTNLPPEGLMDAPLTKEELAQHLRVYESAMSMGCEPPMAIIRANMAVLGTRLYYRKDMLHAEIKAGYARILEQTKEQARREEEALACPPPVEYPKNGSSIIIPH